MSRAALWAKAARGRQFAPLSLPSRRSPPDVAGAVAAELAKNREPRFQLLGVNVGSNQDGNVTFSGKGRFFAPFATHFAFQAQGEYLYNKTPETRGGGE